LAGRPASRLPLPGPQPRSAHLSARRAEDLRGRADDLGPEEARQPSLAAPQLRHSLAGVRHRPPDDSGAPRAQPSQHHGALYPRLDGAVACDPQSPGSHAPTRRGGAPVMTRTRLDVAEVIRSCYDAFLEKYGAVLTPEQRRALDDLMACRTAALGGH